MGTDQAQALAQLCSNIVWKSAGLEADPAIEGLRVLHKLNADGQGHIVPQGEQVKQPPLMLN